MLDLKFVRSNIDTISEMLAARQVDDISVADFVRLDARRRDIIRIVEQLKQRRNQLAREIGRCRQQGHPATDLIAESQEVSNRIKTLDQELTAVNDQVYAWLDQLPNIPLPDVPRGVDENDNIELRRWGTPRRFNFPIRDHVDLGEFLGLLDLSRAAAIAGTNFPLYTGLGARLVRALITFMLDVHTREHGYYEVWPPALVNPTAMRGTGQLPKFHDDLFYLPNEALYLIPTAEVPVTNLVAAETLSADRLPLRLTAYTPCFRREAGAHGRITRGLIRQHQFDKVELVQVTHPEASATALEELTSHAESILQRLELPYRIMVLCTGDLGFAAAKTYDLEVWLPSQDRWLEVSSCSTFTDFQARRMGLRVRSKGGSKTFHPHTLNGSGLAVGRTIVALLENHQQADGRIYVPPALRPYLEQREYLERTPPVWA